MRTIGSNMGILMLFGVFGSDVTRLLERKETRGKERNVAVECLRPLCAQAELKCQR